mmetsp:Transcript_8203/g.22981  ORF Transcript_8203/g.22981 Transcript_8203/m.22981 type:complete len:178 (-) Transcript_8203:98-631(-)
MSARQSLLATPWALLLSSLASSVSAAEPPRRLRAGSPTPGHPGSCETVGNTAPCHCICRCDGEVVGAKTFTADELSAQGDGYCSTASTDNLTAPCVQFCWEHSGSCGSTLEDSPVGMTCTSIGDLPEVSSANATTGVSATLTATEHLPCSGIGESCWINAECCDARCSLTRRCRPAF